MATILIIDDEKSIRKTLQEILVFEGYKIVQLTDLHARPTIWCFVILKCQKWMGLSFWVKQQT